MTLSRRLLLPTLAAVLLLPGSAVAAAEPSGGVSPDPPPPVLDAPAKPATPVPAAPVVAAPGGGKLLPRGGRSLLPDFRLVAYYGHPTTPSLGVLGQGSPAVVTQKLVGAAAKLATPDRPTLPAFELLTSIAQSRPGADRMYRARMDLFTATRWLEVARAARAYLVLELQGGRSDFVKEAKAFEPLLKEPDVGIGIDPEWRVGAAGVPGRTLGSVRASEVNALSSYLGGLVRAGGLPQKLLVVHRFTEDMVRDDAKLVAAPGVATVVNVDAIGGARAKATTYGLLASRLPNASHGLMLFPRRDGKLMTSAQVLGLSPSPDLVGYQ